MFEEFQIFLLAMTPIGELRLAIPVGLGVYNLNHGLVYFISVIGNLIPVIFILLFLAPVSNLLSKKSKIFHKFFSWLFKRTEKKYNSKMERYGLPALAAFIAIPLPITGGWTGALIAFLFKVPFKKAFPIITLGVMTAGIIVLLLTQGGIAVEKHFGIQVLIGVILTVGLGWLMFKKLRGKKV